MPTVTFLPKQLAANVPASTTLLDAAAAAGVVIHAPCGGEGTCGECRCRAESGTLAHDAGGVLSADELAAGWVLACRSRVTGDVTVQAPETIDTGAQIVVDEQPAASAQVVKPEPLAVKCRVTVEPPAAGNYFSDFERLTRALSAQAGPSEFSCGLGVLRKLAAVLRTGQPQITATLLPSRQSAIEIVQLEAGDTTQRAFGLAIDVGTTTCVAQLVDLLSGATAGTASDYNAQLTRGLDVISRINYALAPTRREELRRLVLQTLNALIERLCQQQALRPDEISNAAIAGNTTMMHLLLGLDPEHIRLAPYTPTVNRLPPLRGREVGLAMNPDGCVAFAPGVGSYVGGDITAGLLLTPLGLPLAKAQRRKEDRDERNPGGFTTMREDAVQLFLDIGTNGEVVLGNNEWLMGCACSAGPAFEGCGIGCGMRASQGAIERFRLDPHTGRAEISVIGGGRPRGVCGSGMIDLLAELFRHGWLDPSGKLNPTRGPERVVPATGSSRALAYIVVPKEESATGHAIVLDERDIQNLLRTKAAVYSACALMLKAAGLETGDIERIYVAGGFGRYLDLEKSIFIGLLPDLPLERFTYLGNSSLAGARTMLVSGAARAQVAEVAGRMTYLELNTEPAYMDEYTAALFLPHTDARRFPSVKKARMKDEG